MIGETAREWITFATAIIMFLGGLSTGWNLCKKHYRLDTKR